MKKILVLMLALSLSLTLAACGDEEDRTAPEIGGVEDITIYIDEDFDLMDGVTATDHDGNDITDDIEVSGTVDTSESGTGYLKYSVEDSEGISSEATRNVTVEVDPESVGDEMVSNGDFSMGAEFWKLDTGVEGGEGTHEVEEDELKVTIESASWNMWEPRLGNHEITFEKDQAYEVSFDARAEDARPINVQVGEILDADPYFADFKPGQQEIFELTTDMETYSFDFIMGEDTNDNGSLLFEMGHFDDEDNLETTIYYDNITIEPIEDYTDDIAPVITGAEDKTVTVDGEFDPLEGVTVTDNVDGEITLESSHVEGSVDTSTVGSHELTYTVSDAEGNELVHSRTITVQSTLYEADYGWRVFTNDGQYADTNVEIIDDEYQVEYSSVSASEPWQLQIIQDATAMGSDTDNDGSIEFTSGETYRVTFDAKASVDGDFNLAIGHSEGDWTPYTSETYTIDSTMSTFTHDFTLDDTDADYSVPAQFKLEMGGLFSGASDTESFTLDNVMIEVMNDDDEYEETDLIVNGIFMDEGTLQNGDFSSGMDHWTTSTGQAGGDANFNVVNDELEIEVLSASDEGWEPRLENTGLGFENGKTYEVSFDAKADDVRSINVQVGELLDADPWFTDFKPDVDGVFDLDDSMSNYSFQFDMEEDTNRNGVLTFEFGEIEGDVGMDNLVTNVYLDNVQISEVTD